MWHWGVQLFAPQCVRAFIVPHWRAGRLERRGGGGWIEKRVMSALAALLLMVRRRRRRRLCCNRIREGYGV